MSDRYVTIQFGPEDQYSLSVPITADNKDILVAQFKNAAQQAAKIAKDLSNEAAQLVFDFCTK